MAFAAFAALRRGSRATAGAAALGLRPRPTLLPLAAARGLAAAPPPPAPVPLRKLKDSFLDGTSSTYIEELEERYRADPGSVDKSWAGFFRALEAGAPADAVADAYHAFETGASTTAPLTAASLSAQSIHESMKLLLLVREGRRWGVERPGPVSPPPLPPALTPVFILPRTTPLPRFGATRSTATSWPRSTRSASTTARRPPPPSWIPPPTASPTPTWTANSTWARGA